MAVFWKYNMYSFLARCVVQSAAPQIALKEPGSLARNRGRTGGHDLNVDLTCLGVRHRLLSHHRDLNRDVCTELYCT